MRVQNVLTMNGHIALVFVFWFLFNGTSISNAMAKSKVQIYKNCFDNSRIIFKILLLLR